MGYRTNASDWKVMPIGEISVKNVSVWCFDFKSEEADYSQRFVFAGWVFLIGGIVSGGSTEWTSLECEQAFSASDLNWTRGRVNAQGAGLGIGVGLIRIWAKSYFTKQQCGGVTIAVGSRLLDIDGLWKTL